MAYLSKLFVLSFLAAFQSVVAAPIFYSDQSDFLNSLGSSTYTLEDFESLDAFGSRTNGGIENYAFGDVLIESSTPAIKLMSKKYSGNHNTSPDGKKYLSIDTDLFKQGTEVEFSFGADVKAFGFNIIDHDGDDAAILLNGIEIVVPEVNDGGVTFFGVHLEQWSSSVNFILDSGRDAQISLDDFIILEQQGPVNVDEPGTLAICLVGLLFVTLCRRKQQALS